MPVTDIILRQSNFMLSEEKISRKLFNLIDQQTYKKNVRLKKIAKDLKITYLDKLDRLKYKLHFLRYPLTCSV